MSDFGAVLDYAMNLEASMPEAEIAKFEAIRPAAMGMTARQQEEATKLAAMSPEDRAKAEAEIARKKEENRAKYEEEAAKRQQQAAARRQQQAAQHPATPAPAAPVPAHATAAADDKRK
jgi:hypothetical protein